MFWWQYPITGPFDPPTEHGVDLAMPVGTPIYAAYSGTVLAPAPNIPGQSIESNTGYNPWGGEVDILTSLPGVGQVVNYVFHLDQLVVQPGQAVSAGQLIGYSGGENTLSESNVVPGYTPTHAVPPQYSSGPHIEWGLYQQTGQSPLDPTPYLQALRTQGLAVLGNGSSSGTSSGSIGGTSSGSIGGTVSGTPLAFGLPDVPATIADIKTGFTDVTQRAALVMFGALLMLVGVLVLFFGSESAHALEQGAAQGATEAAVA